MSPGWKKKKREDGVGPWPVYSARGARTKLRDRSEEKDKRHVKGGNVRKEENKPTLFGPGERRYVPPVEEAKKVEHRRNRKETKNPKKGTSRSFKSLRNIF